MNDDFLSSHINDLLKTTRSQVLIHLLRPYTRVHISYIAQELCITIDEVEDLLVSLILDKKIDGMIDQVTHQLHLNPPLSKEVRDQPTDKWREKLSGVLEAVSNKIA